jgi:hypothetical protein
MDMYDRIRDKVSGLTSILKDMNTLTPEMHRDADFSQLYEAIEKRLKEGMTSPAAIGSEDSAPTEKADAHDTASNGSIDVGNIQINGDLSGNIVIGNNNQVSDGRKKKK